MAPIKTEPEPEDRGGSDSDVLARLGERLARERLGRNRTQAELAREAGVSVSTVRRLEAGHSTQLANLIRILRALGLLANLEVLVPEPSRRPLDELERRGRERRRASGKAPPPEDGWSWGDEP